jgi:SAM-dependent methyltransferase
MIINKSRRQLLTNLGLLFAYVKFASPLGLAQTTEELKPLVNETSNFHGVYDNAMLKNEFILFLTNVFHLYPEEKLHALIDVTVKQYLHDKEIYQALQPKLAEIAPILKDLTYSVPALSKQKEVMTAQTIELLGDKKQFARYLELGSTGRYLDGIEEKVTIGDERYFIAEREHTYSPADIVDRGQIKKAGEFISLANYQPPIANAIAKNSLDLVCVYIGFHHCPIHLRNNFIGSIRDLMKPGAPLILRDHHVNSVDMWHMVALAHDVFNLGTMETVDYNTAELRNFYSLDYLSTLMNANGFKTDGRRLYQAGDPTHNALMVFTKS